MKKYEYKVEIFRRQGSVIYSSKELEDYINSFAKNGWVINFITYDPAVTSYQIVFEREM
ncbi:MAG: DUF4177 domain-containing protein [Christensenellales bacterium]|jgi:hypothetical protein